MYINRIWQRRAGRKTHPSKSMLHNVTDSDVLPPPPPVKSGELGNTGGCPMIEPRPPDWVIRDGFASRFFWSDR